MSNRKYDFLQTSLKKRKALGILRKLNQRSGSIDFSSNDYLGLAKNTELFNQIYNRINKLEFIDNGGTGSRLLSGNHQFYDELETQLVRLFRSEAILVFNSGYAANQAIISSVPQKGDTILYDRLAHVCIKEGAWLSKANAFAFNHNDLNDLDRRLKKAEGNVFVITESIFSMDGDHSPIQAIINLCKKYGAHLILDEAHSTGSYGDSGSGISVEKHIHDDIFARVYTFGKSMGVHGACVAGSILLRDYLINFGRPFIYTTSLPPHSIISVIEAFNYLADNPQLQINLANKINYFTSSFYNKTGIKSISDTSIQPILFPGNKRCISAAQRLQKKGFDVRPILAPSVREGTERLRISIHVHNTENEIDLLTGELALLV